MKKTLVVVLLILTVLTGCANTEYNSDDTETGVTYLCTTDGGITPKVNSNGYVYESTR